LVGGPRSTPKGKRGSLRLRTWAMGEGRGEERGRKATRGCRKNPSFVPSNSPKGWWRQAKWGRIDLGVTA